MSSPSPYRRARKGGTRAVPIGVSLPVEMLSEVDAFAHRQSESGRPFTSRSEALRELVRIALERDER